ncbi:MAG TPA: phosphotransferase [Candidatus Tumulicola sp.]|jgi:aminoglycoside phosphotransferase (APT) family kinase protein
MTGAAEWDAEIAIDAAIARTAIGRQFRQLAPLPIEPFGEGWDNAAFLVGDAWVFRFPRRRVAVALMETELRVLPALAPRLPLPIPLPRFAGRPSDAFGWPFAGYARLPGRPLTECVLDDDAETAAAVACGTFLRALHAIAPATLPTLPRDEAGRFEHARCMPKLRVRLAELHALGLIEDPAPLLAFQERIAPAGPRADRLCVVHGDLYARHLLIADARVSGAIDWGDVHVGDPALDLAIGITIFSPNSRPAFARAYGEIDERTWDLARYRGIYSSALVAHYGYRVGDAGLLQSGLRVLNAHGGLR